MARQPRTDLALHCRHAAVPAVHDGLKPCSSGRRCICMVTYGSGGWHTSCVHSGHIAPPFPCRACCGCGWMRRLGRPRRAPSGRLPCPQSCWTAVGSYWGTGRPPRLPHPPTAAPACLAAITALCSRACRAGVGGQVLLPLGVRPGSWVWLPLGLVAAEPGSCSLCLNSGRSTLRTRVSYPTCRRYMRDLPVSYEYLLENLVDPSHIHVS